MKETPTSKSPENTENAESACLNDLLGAEAKLMRAASRFGVAFDENRRWGDEFKRLDYTLTAWKELAVAAVEFAMVHSPITPPEK